MDIQKEKEYLAKTLDAITEEEKRLDDECAHKGVDIVQAREQIWDTIAEMDDYEQFSLQTDAELNSEQYVRLLLRINMLEKQANAPFWGRINYTPEGLKTEDWYIGISSLTDREGNILVVDWRAPIANVYYNAELGEASYQAPVGEQKGVVNFKYQYKIEKGVLKYVIDTATTITDEVLMRELAKNASPVMRNIAATIQKEQNEIIRMPLRDNMLVQGVAGSGKTSIALHRIAYVLYNSRDMIKAKDILIISPNKAFSGYISQVLPELGEENVKQLGMEDIVRGELKGLLPYETRAEYLESVYNGAPLSDEIIQDMRYKASREFVDDLDRHIRAIERKVFKPRNFRVRDYECPKELFEKMFFTQYAAYPWTERMRKIVEYVETDLVRAFHSRINAALHYKICEALNVMFFHYATADVYRFILGKLKQEGKPVIVPKEEDILPFRDVYALLYLRVKTEGTQGAYGKYKQVTVDEMQDYFPVQYAVINHLFHCPKTVLGDLNQIVDPYMNIGSLENMKAMMGDHVFFKLHTSYRSSKEITEFANRLVTEKVKPIERHEEAPEIISCADLAEEARLLDEEVVNAYEKKGYGSVAIIARNKTQAQALAALMKQPVTLLVDTTVPYRGGTVITTALIVKGFEFDEVLVADADHKNYATQSEKRILYVTVTRALHAVKFYHVAPVSSFLAEER